MLIKKFYILFFTTLIFGAYLENVNVTLIQPNGSIVNCFATGDEFYIRLHDDENYTIVQDPVDGYFYYAYIDNGKLRATEYKIDEVNPSELFILPNLNISPDEYKLRRIAKLKNMSRRDAPSFGIINNINIFIRFADEGEFSTPRYIYDEPFNDLDGPSLYNYYLELSYDNLEIYTTHYPDCDMNTNVSYRINTLDHIIKYIIQ